MNNTLQGKNASSGNTNVFKKIAKSPARLAVLIVAVVLAIVFFTLAGIIGSGVTTSKPSNNKGGAPYSTSGSLSYGSNSSVKYVYASYTYYSYTPGSTTYYTFTVSSNYSVAAELKNSKKSTLDSDSGTSCKLRVYLTAGETYYFALYGNSSSSSTRYCSVTISN